VGILCGRKDAVVVLCDKSDAVALKPFVSIALAELFQQAFHEPVTSWIDLLQVGDTCKRVGAVASSSARDFNFSEQLMASFHDGNFHRWHHLLEVDSEKKASGSAADDGCVHACRKR
jgi:hypothetical protein